MADNAASKQGHMPAEISKFATREERLAALTRCALVRRASDNDQTDGVAVWDGKILPMRFESSARPFPFDLLEVAGEPLKSEIEQVFLGHNRILLERNKKKALEWLEHWGDSVKNIKRLDVRLLREDTFDVWDQGSKELFERLINFVANHLDLAHLSLSIDGSYAWEEYREIGSAEDELHFLKDVHNDIVQILSTALAGRKPKALFLYWVAFFDTEAHGEKIIMGEDYDSLKLDKIAHTRRSPYKPHIAQPDEARWSKGFRLDGERD